MSAHDVLAALESVPSVVPVAGLDGVYVREITVDVWERVVEPALENGGTAAGIALVLAGVCDADGSRVYSDDDVDRVRQLPMRVINAIATTANNVNSDGADDAGN